MARAATPPTCGMPSAVMSRVNVASRFAAAMAEARFSEIGEEIGRRAGDDVADAVDLEEVGRELLLAAVDELEDGAQVEVALGDGARGHAADVRDAERGDEPGQRGVALRGGDGRGEVLRDRRRNRPPRGR